MSKGQLLRTSRSGQGGLPEISSARTEQNATSASRPRHSGYEVVYLRQAKSAVVAQPLRVNGKDGLSIPANPRQIIAAGRK